MVDRLYGITFNGHHSSEFGLSVTKGKKIGFPSKNKILVPIPHTNIIYDFSNVTGKQAFGEREIVIPFNVYNKTLWTKERMYTTWTQVVNWLMNTQSKVRLYDDVMKNYYYLAEVQEAPNFDEMNRYGVLTITFKCYPFRISELSEGSDIWDDFNFELDYFQETTATSTLKGFVDVPVGTYATLGAWATNTVLGPAILNKKVGQNFKVLSKHVVNLSLSYYAYTLEGIEGLVYEQDVVQAIKDPTKITLVNSGIAPITPRVITNKKISILMNNVVYNFRGMDTKDDFFQLQPGKNDLIILAIHDANISFEFYKELI